MAIAAGRAGRNRQRRNEVMARRLRILNSQNKCQARRARSVSNNRAKLAHWYSLLFISCKARQMASALIFENHRRYRHKSSHSMRVRARSSRLAAIVDARYHGGIIVSLQLSRIKVAKSTSAVSAAWKLIKAVHRNNASDLSVNTPRGVAAGAVEMWPASAVGSAAKCR